MYWYNGVELATNWSQTLFLWLVMAPQLQLIRMWQAHNSSIWTAANKAVNHLPVCTWRETENSYISITAQRRWRDWLTVSTLLRRSRWKRVWGVSQKGREKKRVERRASAEHELTEAVCLGWDNHSLTDACLLWCLVMPQIIASRPLLAPKQPQHYFYPEAWY